jgi:hypothetical protein
VVAFIEDKYILNLDDLPKCVEADGAVYPIFLSFAQAARLFAVSMQTIEAWTERFGIGVLRTDVRGRGHTRYVNVHDLAEFIRENTFTNHQLRERWKQRRAMENALAARDTAIAESLSGQLDGPVVEDQPLLFTPPADDDGDQQHTVEEPARLTSEPR